MSSPTAELVWITPDAEEQIVHCARVSNPQSQKEGKSPERLIRYLIKHKHWSPFEMASMCVEINTTRDIAAQILRHRSFSFQEFSQRYSKVSVEASIPELRFQDNTNRQSSIQDVDGRLELFKDRIAVSYGYAQSLYHDMISAGVAKECARKVLPLQTPTRLYMAGTIRSWIHYLQVRCGPETQLEHRQVAFAAKALIDHHLPIIHDAVFLSEESYQ